MPPTPADPPGRPADSLAALLDALRPDPEVERIAIGALLSRIAARSFTPLILIPALILVSPLSAIPGAPTLGMIIIVTVAVQGAFGREHVWLPGVVTRRTLPCRALSRALDWLHGPVAWVDRHTRSRLRALTVPPVARAVYVVIALTALPWPLMEMLPMVTSIGAFAVALFAIGLTVRDGAWIVAGFAFLGVLGATFAALVVTIAEAT